MIKKENNTLGPAMIGLGGMQLTEQEKDWLKRPLIGGVVLFARNIEQPAQVHELVESIRVAAGRHLLLAVDQEGGRVQRLTNEVTRLPPLAVLGEMLRQDPNAASDLAYRHGRVMATEILLTGIDLSFAPVLDLDRGSQVIGDRAFSASVDDVVQLGRAYLAGMHDAGMRTTGKHFPGHGSVQADSHTDDVEDGRQLTEIRDSDLVPFRELADQLDAMMMAHVVYPDVSRRPAGYSRTWINEILRGELGYRGVVLSDDLGMQAALVAGDLVQRARATLDAGCDAFLVCGAEDTRTFMEAAGDDWPDASNALAGLAGRLPLSRAEVESVSEWRQWSKSLQALAERSA